MSAKFSVEQQLSFMNQPAMVRSVEDRGDGFWYYCETGSLGLPMWVPESFLDLDLDLTADGPPAVVFDKRTPHLFVVDEFYKDPYHMRAVALGQKFVEDSTGYKGKRTQERFLWPWLREEFERIMGGRKIIDWLNQPANGVFQSTSYSDPLVYHSDSQDYAAAIYLTPQMPVSCGTSFWRDKNYGCRRPPNHELESSRFSDDGVRHEVLRDVYSSHNITHPDNWELVDRVGSVFNRLVIWDAKMIHSASSYEGMSGKSEADSRLVQLFFFSVR